MLEFIPLASLALAASPAPQLVQGGPSSVGHGAHQPSYVLRNLELAARLHTGQGGSGLDLEPVVVWESEQGGSDLNGDGDALDAVLHLVDPATGAIHNLGLDCSPASFAGAGVAGRIALLVRETAQGGTDLNGDGDALDSVAFVHDTSTGLTRNLALAAGTFVPISSKLAAVPVSEADQGGSDRNGDGDAKDRVLSIVDLDTGAALNLGLAIGIGQSALHDGLVAFPVNELQQGQDLNSDGSLAGRIVHVYEHSQAQVTNLMFRQAYTARTGPGQAAFLAMELGLDDFNGDGDAEDMVVHVYDAAGAAVSNLGLACIYELHAAPEHLIFDVFESTAGGIDLNGDGDALDDIPHARAWSGANVVAAPLSSALYERIPIGDRFALIVREKSEGLTDLNGDGDALDYLVSIFDPVVGSATATGLAVGLEGMDFSQLRRPTAGARWLPVPVLEEAAGDSDLDGDGDAADAVWHVYDVQTGLVENLGRGHGVGLAASGDSLVALTVGEAAWGGADLNGDGDALDTCLAVWDPIRDRLIDVPMACAVPIVHGRTVLFSASEAAQGGKDLNGDGDATDHVLMLLLVP